MCHVEGRGSGWFDDLELVAYDRDFDARYGRNNRLSGPNSLDRWVGAWKTEYVCREFDNQGSAQKQLSDLLPCPLAPALRGERLCLESSESGDVFV